MNVVCNYCQRPALLVTGKTIYPHRPDLYQLQFWNCDPCGAWVGCHKGTIKPLGRLANAELRQAKQEAHNAFDPFWRSNGFHGQKLKRSAAYKWLAKQLGVERIHIGECDVETCRRVVKICTGESQ